MEIHTATTILYLSKRRCWRWTVSLADSSWWYACSSRHHPSFFAAESDCDRFSSEHLPDVDWRVHTDRVSDADRQPTGSAGVRRRAGLEHIAVGLAELKFRRFSTDCDVCRYRSNWPRRFFRRCPYLRLERNRDPFGHAA